LATVFDFSHGTDRRLPGLSTVLKGAVSPFGYWAGLAGCTVGRDRAAVCKIEKGSLAIGIAPLVEPYAACRFIDIRRLGFEKFGAVGAAPKGGSLVSMVLIRANKFFAVDIDTAGARLVNCAEIPPSTYRRLYMDLDQPADWPPDLRIRGRASDGSLFLVSGNSLLNNNASCYGARLFKIDCSGGRALMASWLVIHPGAFEGVECALSPRGDRIAWIVNAAIRPEDPKTLIGRWLARLSGSDRAVRQQAEFKVSSLDGKDMRTVGFIPNTGEHVNTFSLMSGGRTTWKDAFEKGSYFTGVAAPVASGVWASEHPTCIAWTPDGSHLSFAYKGAIWRVPIEH